MKTTSVSNFRKDIKHYVDEVHADQEPLVVTRSDNVSVVVLSLDEYNSITETDYLTKNPVNAQRLRESALDAAAGRVKKHAIIEP